MKIDLDAKEAKALLDLVSADGKGMAPKRLTDALQKRMTKELSAIVAEKPETEAPKKRVTPMMKPIAGPRKAES